ncbi:SgrR family transcriptional regulator, partial [Salmonella enterica subsp. enterica serovar Weltevreden]|nr:SgrR family transcriptional regulator [Salmonella enterica subsp. enterica serovar Weltevreden]
VQIAIGNPEELETLSQLSCGISLGFCYLTIKKGSRLNVLQARRLIHIIHHTSLLKNLPVDENLIMPSKGLLPGWTIRQW